jgi:MFS family permease
MDPVLPARPTNPPGDLARTFLRWSFARGACSRGWWLVASVYLVVVADLTAAELVLLGTGQAIVVVLAEVPAGVFADTVSRKWSLVVAAATSATGMVLTGLVTVFPALVVAQMLWGLGWAFTSGADVAWVTDELDRPDRIDRVLAARARWELTGAAAGLVAFGALAWGTDLPTALVTAGLAMGGLGVFVAIRFPERHFVPAAPDERWRHAVSTLRGGVRLAVGDREILLVVVAWLLVNGSGEGYGRLVEKRLLSLGFGDGGDAVLWFAALGVVTLVLSAIVLRAVEARIDGPGVARRTFVAGCAVGVAGLVLFAAAPDPRWALVGTLLVSGSAHPGAVLRAVGEIWVNRRTASAVRATVHSLLSQAEHVGEIVFGLLLASLAAATSLTASLVASAVLLAAAGVSAACAGQFTWRAASPQ